MILLFGHKVRISVCLLSNFAETPLTGTTTLNMIDMFNMLRDQRETPLTGTTTLNPTA